MKIICHECESELEIVDLHEDGSEILVKPCKDCAKAEFDSGYEDGLSNCGCTENDYEEGYKEGYDEAKGEYETRIDELKEQISELKESIEDLKNP